MQHVIRPLPGSQPEIGRAIWMLEDARHRTQRVLEGLNPAHVDWANSEGGHTIGTLLYHIAAIEIDWLYTDVLEQSRFHDIWDDFPYDVRTADGLLTRISGVSLKDHRARLDKVRALLLDAYKGMTIEDFRHARNLDNYDVTPEWVLHHLCQHEAEHRSEVSALRQGAEKHAGEAT